MNKEVKIFKIQNYDYFRCTADKCKFTCCSVWDVNIDNNTYIKWKNNKKNYILQNVIEIINDDEVEYFINKETQEKCPFLDNKGLCNIVKNDGEECLSLTCKKFPRIENVLEGRKEITLSCACPEVVENISKLKGKIKMISSDNKIMEEKSTMYKVRELLIYIIQEKKLSLDDKLILCFDILINMLSNDISKNQILKEYKSDKYISNVLRAFSEIEFNIEEAIEELNYLFLDITENYKDVEGLENSLREIYKFSESKKDKNYINKWIIYKKTFEQYNELIENCIVSKILSECTSEDFQELALSFQLIILEYLLMRYTVFLKYYTNNKNEISIEDIKEYIVVFSRVISNNSEAVLEFLEDGFGKAILDIGYIKLIMI